MLQNFPPTSAKEIRILVALIFVTSCILLGVRWLALDAGDVSIWADEARFVQTGDAREFDMGAGYGHPGGPVIEGTIALHALGLSWDLATRITVIILSSLAITILCLVCYALRKDVWWPAVAFLILTTSWMYHFVTPPSAVATALTVLLWTLTLYLLERPTKGWHAAGWGIIAGMLVATRIDIGGIAIVALGLLCLTRLNLRQLLILAASLVVSFIAFDPFMWFMPVQHLVDLLSMSKFIYASMQRSMSLLSVFTISALSIVSLVCALVLIYWKKLPIPRRAFVALLCMSVVVYVSVLTSRYQAGRYYLPILLTWEVMLPLFLSQLVSGRSDRRRAFVKWGLPIFIFSYNAVLIGLLIWQTYNVYHPELDFLLA